MFLDMAFGSPIYERLRALGFNNVFEVNFGLTHTPDRAKANMRAYMWGEMKDWLLTGAIETDEKMAMDLAGPGYHINRSNLLVLESKADMQKRGQASPDDGDAIGSAPANFGRVRFSGTVEGLNGRREKVEDIAADQPVVVREGAGIVRRESFSRASIQGLLTGGGTGNLG